MRIETDYMVPCRQTFVVSSNRFYIDELPGGTTLMETMERFNRMVEWFYNRIYDEKFLQIPFPYNGTTTAAIKEYYNRTYGGRISDYYVTSIQSRVGGMISSQKELLKLQKQENDIRIAACEDKVRSIEESLAVHQEIKQYLAALSRSYKKGTTAPGNEVPVKYDFQISGNTIRFHDSKGMKHLNLYLYECSLDRKMRWEKQTSASIREKIKRLQVKKFDIPARITFGGGKAFYKTKDTKLSTPDGWKAWHEKRTFSRNCRVNFSGRHTSRYGNYQCCYDVITGCAEITLLDGSLLRLGGIRFPYRGDELMDYIKNRCGSVGYVLERKTDGHGRDYLILKAAVTLEKEHVNDSFADGCVAFDTNADCLAWCELDGTGCRIKTGVIPFRLDNMSTAVRKETLAKAVNQVVDYAVMRHKPVVMEDLDFLRKKAGMGYKDKAHNRMLSAFAYSSITQLTRSRCFKADTGLSVVPPAFTSLIGKLKYMRPLGTSVHCAAAYVIGRRAMGYTEEIPAYLRRPAQKSLRAADFWKRWKSVNTHTPKLPWYMFRKKFPTLVKWGDFEKCFQ